MPHLSTMSWFWDFLFIFIFIMIFIPHLSGPKSPSLSKEMKLGKYFDLF